MSTETISKPASAGTTGWLRTQWIDAFNARDDEGEAGARTAGYTARQTHALRHRCHRTVGASLVFATSAHAVHR
ncbi:MAG: hypothetical protein WB761_00200 [Solirubrobacteraceae bacterium]